MKFQGRLFWCDILSFKGQSQRRGNNSGVISFLLKANHRGGAQILVWYYCILGLNSSEGRTFFSRRLFIWDITAFSMREIQTCLLLLLYCSRCIAFAISLLYCCCCIVIAVLLLMYCCRSIIVVVVVSLCFYYVVVINLCLLLYLCCCCCVVIVLCQVSPRCDG